MLALIFFTQISWGTIGLCGVLFVSQNNKRFRTLEAIVPSHSFAKNHSSLADYPLLNFTFTFFASEKRIPGKWRRQECDYGRNSMNNRNTVAMDRLACSRSASSCYRMFLFWRIKRSMWTLDQACADRSTSQVYLWAITVLQEKQREHDACLLRISYSWFSLMV